jgi:hypothetical protein
MPGTPETPLPVEETYRDLLRSAVEAAGSQRRAADMAGVTQPTISRTLTPGTTVTYTTLRKLADALPGMPDPVIAVRDAAHERWCKCGAALAELKPDDFRILLAAAERLLDSRLPKPTDAQVNAVKAAIASSDVQSPARRRARR